MEAEKHFTFYQFSDEEKKGSSSGFLGRGNLTLVSMGRPTKPHQRLASFEVLVLGNFKPSNVGDLYEQRLSVEQGGKMADYRRKFVGGVTHFKREPEAILNRAFLRGFNDNIKTKVRVLGPTNEEQIMQ